MDLKGKVVIVTGSARGLGRAFAVRFSREGARVVVCDVLDGSDTAREIAAGGGEVLALRTDVASEASTLEMARRTVERFGRVDVLVNNAAMQADIVRRPFWEIGADEWDRVMAVNLRGMFLCCKAVFPFMKQQGRGKIINLASAAALSGGSTYVHYVTSKGGAIAFTRAMAREMGEYNINVNALAPGLTMTEAMADRVSPVELQPVVNRRCFKREERAADLTGAVLFLASEESDFVTGQTIVVDGGSVFH